jgi:hypothetical protein
VFLLPTATAPVRAGRRVRSCGQAMNSNGGPSTVVRLPAPPGHSWDTSDSDWSGIRGRLSGQRITSLAEVVDAGVNTPVGGQSTAQAGRLRHAGVGAASVSATPARGRWELA